MESVRKSKENYYLDIAETVLERGTCLRRNYGAIIVKNAIYTTLFKYWNVKVKVNITLPSQYPHNEND